MRWAVEGWRTGERVVTTRFVCSRTARSARVLGRPVDGGPTVSFRLRLAIYEHIQSALPRSQPRRVSVGVGRPDAVCAGRVVLDCRAGSGLEREGHVTL